MITTNGAACVHTVHSNAVIAQLIVMCGYVFQLDNPPSPIVVVVDMWIFVALD